MGNLDKASNKYKGCLLGLAVGDASGKGSYSGQLDREARKFAEDREFGRRDVPDLQGAALRVVT